MNREEMIAELRRDPLLSRAYELDCEQAEAIADFLLTCTDPVYKLVYGDVFRRLIACFASAHQSAFLALFDRLVPEMSASEDNDEVVYEEEGFLWIE